MAHNNLSHSSGVSVVYVNGWMWAIKIIKLQLYIFFPLNMVSMLYLLHFIRRYCFLFENLSCSHWAQWTVWKLPINTFYHFSSFMKILLEISLILLVAEKILMYVIHTHNSISKHKKVGNLCAMLSL